MYQKGLRLVVTHESIVMASEVKVVMYANQTGGWRLHNITPCLINTISVITVIITITYNNYWTSD